MWHSASLCLFAIRLSSVQPIRQNDIANRTNLAQLSPTHVSTAGGSGFQKYDGANQAVNTQPMSLVHAEEHMVGELELESLYNNLQLKGSGSFGYVYFANDKTNGQSVAVKVPKIAPSPGDLESKCNKIQKLTENIESVSEAGGIHIMHCLKAEPKFVTYEWSGTQGVEKLLDLDSFDSAFGLLKQVMLALYAMQHSHPPYIHHDLKWENVAVDENNCLRLIDLDDSTEGIWGAREHGSTTASALYAPPEYTTTRKSFHCGLRAGTADTECPRSYAFDMYSAGLMVYEACSLDWMSYFEEWNKHKEAVIEDTIGIAEEDGMAIHAAVTLLGLNIASDLKDPTSILAALKKFDPEAIQAVVEHFKSQDDRIEKIGANAINRLKGCKQKMEDVDFNYLPRMIAEIPSGRPTPGELLGTLFAGVNTGCNLDVEEEDQFETTSVITEIEEDPKETLQLECQQCKTAAEIVDMRKERLKQPLAHCYFDSAQTKSPKQCREGRPPFNLQRKRYEYECRCLYMRA